MLRAIICACLLLAVSGKKRVKLNDNGYEGVVIAINNEVPEDEALVDAIKEMMTNASDAMYSATGARAYFRKVTILVPKSWTLGSYETAGTETYGGADIRISPPRPQQGDKPYAWGYGGCGKPGIYIYFTPAYVMDDSVSSAYGRRDRVVVHEWAHYRWGVKDEYPTGGTRKHRHENSFYLSTSGLPEATRCPLNIRGKLGEGDDQCQYDNATRLPLLGCQFQPHETQENNLRASLMYGQYLEKVTIFCHDDPKDPTNMHNKEAPNNQNRQCDQQSAWQVIMNSDDFVNGQLNTPGSATRNTEPTFRVVKAQKKRIVLVLDSSGSMEGDRLVHVIRVSEIFLKRLIGDGTYVGLVEFSKTRSIFTNGATILHNLLEVKHDDDSRDRLVNALEKLEAYGGTSIGRGILKGMQVLRQQSAEGGHLVVLTDGEENVTPYVASITDDVVAKKVIVHAIFFGLSNITEGSSLVTLSERTEGQWYYAGANITDFPELTSIFAALARPHDGDLSTTSVQISSAVETPLENGGTINSTIAIDGSVGKKTAFIFTWWENQPAIEVMPPAASCIYSNVNKPNVTYCESAHVTDLNANTVTFIIPGKAKPGMWKYTIGNVTGITTVTVTSAPSAEGVYPITVEPELSLTNVSGNEAAVVVTTVMQNTVPVLGATVLAKITRPTGDPVTFDLLDNGAGADETKNDGVYSRYFSEFNAQGRYSVQVTVFKNGSDPAGVANLPGAPFNSGTVLDNGTFVPGIGDVNVPDEISGAEIDGDLQRIATSTGLAYTGNVTTSDIFPPNKITDLSVSQVDVDDPYAGLRLTFTAPGDDYDSGTAKQYEIRHTTNSSEALRTDFERQPRIANISIPNSALSAEAIAIPRIRLNIPENLTSIRIAFAIRSFDEVNNPSDISNIAIVTYFLRAPPLPIAPTTAPSPMTSISSAYSTLRDESILSTSSAYSTLRDETMPSTSSAYSTLRDETMPSRSSAYSTLRDEPMPSRSSAYSTLRDEPISSTSSAYSTGRDEPTITSTSFAYSTLHDESTMPSTSSTSPTVHDESTIPSTSSAYSTFNVNFWLLLGAIANVPCYFVRQ